MEQWQPPDSGTTRISNPKTLERWIHQGKFQELIDEGYDFYPGCGRFKTEVCTCHKCRTKSRKNLQEVINKHFKNKNR